MTTARKAEPRFDRDVVYGRQGELQINDFLDWIANGDGRVETKRKRILDHKFYIETEKDPGRTGVYRPGGINETTAALWCIVIGDTGIHVGIPTDLLREMIHDPSSRPAREDDGSCPTRGVIVDFCVLLYRLRQRLEREGKRAPSPPPAVESVPAGLSMTWRDIGWGGRNEQ